MKKYSYAQYITKIAPKKLDLSLVIPAYNEEMRLPVMLKETVKVEYFFEFFCLFFIFLKTFWQYFENKCNPKLTYELIVVNDGSKDKTYIIPSYHLC